MTAPLEQQTHPRRTQSRTATLEPMAAAAVQHKPLNHTLWARCQLQYQLLSLPLSSLWLWLYPWLFGQRSSPGYCRMERGRAALSHSLFIRPDPTTHPSPPCPTPPLACLLQTVVLLFISVTGLMEAGTACCLCSGGLSASYIPPKRPPAEVHGSWIVLIRFQMWLCTILHELGLSAFKLIEYKIHFYSTFNRVMYCFFRSADTWLMLQSIGSITL